MPDDLFARAQRFWDQPNLLGDNHRRMWLAAVDLAPELVGTKWDELTSEERFGLLRALQVGLEFGGVCALIRGRALHPSSTPRSSSPVARLSPKRGPKEK